MDHLNTKLANVDAVERERPGSMFTQLLGF